VLSISVRRDGDGYRGAGMQTIFECWIGSCQPVTKALVAIGTGGSAAGAAG
jgi:hypothetical protein